MGSLSDDYQVNPQVVIFWLFLPIGARAIFNFNLMKMVLWHFIQRVVVVALFVF